MSRCKETCQHIVFGDISCKKHFAVRARLMWCDTPAVNLNHHVTGGSTVHTINIEIHATGAVSPEIPSRVFVISLHWFPHLRIRSRVSAQNRAQKLLSSKLSTKDQNSDLAFMQWVCSPKSEHGNSLHSQQQRITPKPSQLHQNFDFKLVSTFHFVTDHNDNTVPYRSSIRKMWITSEIPSRG